jgi:hypothetical protein
VFFRHNLQGFCDNLHKERLLENILPQHWRNSPPVEFSFLQRSYKGPFSSAPIFDEYPVLPVVLVYILESGYYGELEIINLPLACTCLCWDNIFVWRV